MTIDNFDELRPFLKFDSEDDFYYLQIIQRRKENPDLNKSEKLIRTYDIRSLEYYYRKKEQIIDLCNYFNARAYFWINKRNYKDIAFAMNSLLADYLYSNQFGGIFSIVDKTVGRNHSDPNKKWIIDIDTKEGEVVGDISNVIKDCEPYKEKIIDLIDTKNGFHLITSPFNTKQFSEIMTERMIDTSVVTVHKDNPTVLYIP